MKYLSQIKPKALPLVIYSYIALPFVIFTFFMKWYFAIPAALIVILSVLLAAHSSECVGKIAVSKNDAFKIIGGLILIIILVLLSGIGNVAWQNNDHATRNTIFQILGEQPLPPVSESENGVVALCYYVGFWLPAALIGKLTTLSAGFVFQIIWAAFGIALIWLLICSAHKKVVFYPLVIFLFFSGLDVFGYEIVSRIFDMTSTQIGAWGGMGNYPSFTYHIEWWGGFYQYSSHITQLFWVFNQALPVWLSTALLISEKSSKNLVFIMGLTLLSSTLPFIGLIPIFLWCAFSSHEGSLFKRPCAKTFDDAFFSLFTVQNIFGGGVSGIISFLYLRGNINSASSSAGASAGENPFTNPAFYIMLVIFAILFFVLNRRFSQNPVSLVAFVPILAVSYLFASVSRLREEYYILFILFEVIALLAPLYPAFKQASLYWIVTFSLLIIPFFTVGKSIDFCMRASIPALFTASLMAGFALKEYFSQKRFVPLVSLIVILVIGAITPLHEILRSIIASSGEFENSFKSVQSVFDSGNFTALVSDSFFFEYLAK